MSDASISFPFKTTGISLKGYSYSAVQISSPAVATIPENLVYECITTQTSISSEQAVVSCGIVNSSAQTITKVLDNYVEMK